MKSWALQLFFIFLLFLPTQFGKHFWFAQSLVLGRRIDYLSPTLYFSDVLLILVFLLTFFVPLRPNQRTVSYRAWILIFSLVSISWVGASFKIPAFYYGARFLEMAMLVAIILRLKPALNTILIPLALGVLLEVCLAAAQFITQKSLGGPWWLLGERTFTSETPGIAQAIVGGRLFLRPYGTFPHPNVMAGYLTAILPLFLGWKISLGAAGEIKVKFLWILRQAAVYFSLLGIALSFSRSAWLVGFGVILACLHINDRQNRYLAVKILIVGIGILLIEELAVGRLLSINGFDRATIFERAKLTQAALKLILTSPLFGHGLGSFILLLPTVTTAPYLLQPVHSVFLLILAETGIYGLVITGGFLFNTLRRVWKNSQWYLLLAFLTVLALGSNDHYFITLNQGRLLCAVFIGYAYCTADGVK